MSATPHAPHALVTGGGRGIGRAIAAALAKQGMTVTVLGRKPTVLDEAVAAGDAHFADVADVASEPSVTAAIGRAAERQPIQTCTNVGCFLTVTLSDKLIAAMRTGHELKFAMQDANKKPVEIALPLLGFGLAFDKAK